jgi:hypothetical protein
MTMGGIIPKRWLEGKHGINNASAQPCSSQSFKNGAFVRKFNASLPLFPAEYKLTPER